MTSKVVQINAVMCNEISSCAANCKEPESIYVGDKSERRW